MLFENRTEFLDDFTVLEERQDGLEFTSAKLNYSEPGVSTGEEIRLAHI